MVLARRSKRQKSPARSEMVTRVVSKIATPSIKTGASHAERCEAFSTRNFNPNVAIKNPKHLCANPIQKQNSRGGRHTHE